MVGAERSASNRCEAGQLEMGQIALIGPVLVGLGAGAASALLFVSVVSGSALSLLLFYLAPLPILISVLGWSHWAGLAAGFTAATIIGALLGINHFLSFLVAVALPAWWLGYLSMLARSVGTNGSATLEWYPVGRLVLWAALLAALVAMLAIPEFSTNRSQLQAAVKELFERVQSAQADQNGWSAADIDRIVDITLDFLLPIATISFALRNIFNLWLAGCIVKMSGRLKRPWPDLSTLTLPPFALMLLGLAVVGSMLPDIAGTIAAIVAASLITAYAILGFAILHAVTRGFAFRAYLLFSAYFTVVVLAAPLLGLPILAITVLGLADHAFRFRARMAQKPGPPTPPNSNPPHSKN